MRVCYRQAGTPPRRKIKASEEKLAPLVRTAFKTWGEALSSKVGVGLSEAGNQEVTGIVIKKHVSMISNIR